MDHHRHAVGGEAHVALEAVGAGGAGRARTPSRCSPGRSPRRRDGANTSGRSLANTGRRRETARPSHRVIIATMTVIARPATLGALKKALARGDYARRSVRDEVRDNLIVKLRARRAAVSWRRRLRRNRDSATRQRDSRQAPLHPARPARPGEDAAHPRAGRPARRGDPGRAGQRDPRRSAGADCRPTGAPWSPPKATTCPSTGGRARPATWRSWRRPT